MDGLAQLIAVTDTLYSPGGCPWDGKQTHKTLVKHLLEEAYEYVDAVEEENRIDMREELGDVLLQVVFHARIAAEDETDPFTLDDVARENAEKLIRRHPHVFSDTQKQTQTAQQVHDLWEKVKQEEKQRTSVLDGVAKTQGALTRSEKIISRLFKQQRMGNTRYNKLLEELDATQCDAHNLGEQLLGLIVRAQKAGISLDTELRYQMRIMEEKIVAAEANLSATGQ